MWLLFYMGVQATHSNRALKNVLVLDVKVFLKMKSISGGT